MARRSFVLLWLLLFFLPVALFVACDPAAEEATPDASPTATSPAQTIPLPTPDLATTPIVAETPPPAQQTITLTVWTRPEIVPNSEEPGSAALLEQLTAFDAQHAELNLLVEAKASTGQGGALSYLRSGRNVAPSILPDLLLLPAVQLGEAAGEGLVYPLDSLLTEEMTGALYPAARALGQVDGVTYGYPYALTNVQHLVYDTAAITRTLPASWSQMMAPESQVRLLLPAGGLEGARLTLQLYLEAGGTLRNESGQLALQVEPLAAALSQLQQALAGGRILPESASATTLDQTWQLFQNSTANTVLADTMTYRRRNQSPGRYAFVSLPGLDGAMPLRAGALLWVVTTPDPVRQAKALELVAWLTSPPNLAAWSHAANYVPPRADALALWPTGDAHAAYLARMLPDARPYPVEASPAVLAALAEATQNVASGVQTAADAAQTAAATLNP